MPLDAQTTPTTDICQVLRPTTEFDIPDNSEPTDDALMFMDDSNVDDTTHPIVGRLCADVERSNFDHFIGPDLSQYLVNPNLTVYTNARRVEVTLLKILTELETPLFAFKVLMDWAFDATQSGYNFIPRQQTYPAQLQSIAKWVGMEHMRPKVVNVPLPRIRLDDSIPVTTFEFVSQLHSLLSDKELNTTTNL